jgi:ABC-2 type transport system permease protein
LKAFTAALWAEALKARRSLISPLTAAGVLLLPLAGGLFTVILKDPERARSMGLISAKAQIMLGVADWSSYFGILLQGMAAAGAIIFALITAWLFGAEFVDHTAKDWLALPVPRATIVTAKLVLLAFWDTALICLVFLGGLLVGRWVVIPGWTPAVAWSALGSLLAVGIMTYMMMPLVAFLASVGRGYLAPMAWALFTLAVAQISAVLGWGDWVPWAVPGLRSGAAGESLAHLGLHSYVVVAATFLLGAALTVVWWRQADQTR